MVRAIVRPTYTYMQLIRARIIKEEANLNGEKLHPDERARAAGLYRSSLMQTAKHNAAQQL